MDSTMMLVADASAWTLDTEELAQVFKLAVGIRSARGVTIKELLHVAVSQYVLTDLIRHHQARSNELKFVAVELAGRLTELAFDSVEAEVSRLWEVNRPGAKLEDDPILLELIDALRNTRGAGGEPL